MYKRIIYFVPAVTLLFIVCLSVLADRELVYTVQTKEATDGSVVRTPHLTTVSELQAQQSAPGPRVHVDAPVHDFGRLDPLTVQEHVFIIRNTGDAPLELTEGPTTCKCTLSKLQEGAVPPGGKASVKVQWNTGRDESYAHSATIYTNDPRNRVVQLRIKGKVQTVFRCAPSHLVFTRLGPGEAASATTTVFSQIWDDMELEPIVPTLPGLQCSVEEVDAGQLQSLEARSARRILVTLPTDLPEGYFDTTLVIRGKPRGGTGEPVECELSLAGKVIRRLSVYGPEIDVQGTVDLGRLRQGRSAHVRLMLKLRDAQRELPVKRIEVFPKFLNVRLEPAPVDDSQSLGLYYLHIDVPKDAPTFRLPPTKKGFIRIEFDHPRVTELELPVDLIVTPRDGV